MLCSGGAMQLIAHCSRVLALSVTAFESFGAPLASAAGLPERFAAVQRATAPDLVFVANVLELIKALLTATTGRVAKQHQAVAAQLQQQLRADTAAALAAVAAAGLSAPSAATAAAAAAAARPLAAADVLRLLETTLTLNAAEQRGAREANASFPSSVDRALIDDLLDLLQELVSPSVHSAIRAGTAAVLCASHCVGSSGHKHEHEH